MIKFNNIKSFFILVVWSVLMVWFGVGMQRLDYKHNLISIEYIEDCKCGGKIECYKSFVDGYERKECKECGSYFDSQDK